MWLVVVLLLVIIAILAPGFARAVAAVILGGGSIILLLMMTASEGAPSLTQVFGSTFMYVSIGVLFLTAVFYAYNRIQYRYINSPEGRKAEYIRNISSRFDFKQPDIFRDGEGKYRVYVDALGHLAEDKFASVPEAVIYRDSVNKKGLGAG